MELTSVQSSNVQGVAKDGEDLIVKFHSSPHAYRYKGAGSHLGELLEADSVGRFVNASIKGNYEFEKIDLEETEEGSSDAT